MSTSGHFIYTGESLYDKRDNVVTVTIDDSVTDIGYEAFQWCSNLESIIIPPTITSIGGFAFRECSKLQSITIPPSVTKIGDCAFDDCSNLKSISIHPSTKIRYRAFLGCPNLDEDSIQQINNCFIKSNNLTLRNTFKEGDGPLGFKGATQKGYGPEMWGITLKQIQDIMEHPLIDYKTLMRDVVRLAIKPITKQARVGYVLLANQDAPLKAKIMVSVSISTFEINCVFKFQFSIHLHSPSFIPSSTFCCLIACLG